MSRHNGRRAYVIPVLPHALRVEEASLLTRCGIMVPPDTRLPTGWHLSARGLAVEPVPIVCMTAMSCTLRDFRKILSLAEWSKQHYTLDSRRWPEILAT